MTVSVIIPTFDRSVLLRQSVASVMAQTYRDVQLIVAYDKDGAGPFETFQRSLPLTDGEYVWFFSDDDVADPRFLEAALAGIGDAGWCRSDFFLWDGSQHVAIRTDENLNAIVFRRKTLDLVEDLYGHVFPPELRQYADSVLVYRLRRMRLLQAHIHQPLIYSRAHPGQMSRQVHLRMILDNAHARNLMDGTSAAVIVRQFGWLLRSKMPGGLKP